MATNAEVDIILASTQHPGRTADERATSSRHTRRVDQLGHVGQMRRENAMPQSTRAPHALP